jgi:hypothetical protein
MTVLIQRGSFPDASCKLWALEWSSWWSSDVFQKQMVINFRKGGGVGVRS